MTDSLENAITRLQVIGAAMSSITDMAGNAVTIKSAPVYPVENEEPLPACYAFETGGEFEVVNATQLINFPLVNVEFHFSRTNLKQAYKQARQVIYEYPRRIAKDPQLGGSIQTVVMSGDSKVPYTARPFVWREKTATAPALVTHCVTFQLTLKLFETPLSTP